MSVYLFGENSLVDEVSIQHSDGGGARAYLHARDGSNPAALDAIKNILTANNMQWSPMFIGDKATLEVRGFKGGEDNLLRLLEQSNALHGAFKKEQTVSDTSGFWDKVFKNTLRWCGFAYLIGDAGYFNYQWKKSFDANGKFVNPQGIAAGIFYGLGTPILALYGQGDKSDFQIKDVAHHTLRELQKQGITIPKDSAIETVGSRHAEGWWKKFTNFLTRYPAEIENSILGCAGLMIIWDGIKSYRSKAANYIGKKSAQDKKSILMDIGLGCMTTLAGLISVFVEEEAPDPDTPKKTGLARTWQYIKEKPLRAAGGALMVSTVCHAGATINDWKKSSNILNSPSSSAAERAGATELKKALPGRAVFAATNFTAEGFMAISSKGHGAGVKTDNSLDRSVHALMADLILRSPTENREKLITILATFLSDKRHLGGKAAAIEAGIREQLASFELNPWAGAKLAKTVPIAAPVVAEEKSPERTVNWQAKTMQPPSPALSQAMA